jgi:hypothetical protein
MSHTRYPTVEGASETAAAPDRVLNRRSVFARLLEALHESRRLQAAREIHRHRHLLQKHRADTTGE